MLDYLPFQRTREEHINSYIHFPLLSQKEFWKPLAPIGCLVLKPEAYRGTKEATSAIGFSY